MYRLLLLLLPRRRRAAYGAEMAEVFAAVSTHAKDERGWLGIAVIWMKEAIGMVRFSARERLTRFNAGASAAGSNGGGASWRDEVVWAWRGVRGRRWRAVAIVLLFGISLGANAIVFSAADAFVFRTVPYAKPEQLVVMQRVSQGSGAIDYAF